MDLDLEWLFWSDEEMENNQVESNNTLNPCDAVTEKEDIIVRCKKQQGRRGRPSIVDKYPEIVSVVRKYIEQSTSAAHLRRRTEIMYTNGVTLNDIVKHVKKTIPGIQVKKDTIHRMLQPVRRRTINSKRYKSFVHARIPAKMNSGMRKTHQDFHYTQSQVSLVNQLAQLCVEDTVGLSVDNKNKVEVGNVAVSRRCRVRKYCMKGDGANHNDHDFPHKNCKLVPAGYQLRTLKTKRGRSVSPRPNHTPYFSKKQHRRSFSEPPSTGLRLFKGSETGEDRIGRCKVLWPRSGPLNVQLYPSRSIESTSVMHMNFLLRYLANIQKQQPLYNVVAIADGGPDWSVKGVLNLMAYGYLWKHLALDTLVIQCFAPGCSRFNPIERSWSYLTQCMVGVELRDEIEENNFKIPGEHELDKWNTILDRAVDDCGRFWNGRQLDSFPITIFPFYSSDPLIPHLKAMHGQLKIFKDASKKKLDETPELGQLQNQYMFFVKHCNRKAYQLEFIRCPYANCAHCTSLPVRQNAFLDVIRGFGGSLPSPVKSIRKEHYKSLEEMLRLNNANEGQSKPVLDNCTIHGSCPYATCNYAFFSLADINRHYKLMGHDNKQKPVTQTKKNGGAKKGNRKK